MKHKSVDISGMSLRPVPTELHEKVMCTNCQKNAARWEFAEGAAPASAFACSSCLLYEVPRLKEQRLQLEFLVSGVEKRVSTIFDRDAEGRLSNTDDADRIAFGLVMTNRFMQSRVLRGGFE